LLLPAIEKKKIENSMGILLFIGGIFLPSVILGLLVRLAPIQRFAQRTKLTRGLTLLGNGLLSWGITLEILMSLMAYIAYGLAKFYFSATFGLVSGITRATVEQYQNDAILEIWFRQFIPWVPSGQVCFNSSPIVCQLADQAIAFANPSDMILFLSILALLPTAVNLLLGWYFTRQQSRKT
jgi:hypothetical protein